MDTRNENLRRARELAAKNRAAGIEPTPRMNPIEKAKAAPKSLTKALRAYYWQHHSVVENKGNEAAQMLRDDAEADYAAARARSREIGLPRVIREICFICEAGDSDPGGRYRVRDCSIKTCALHPVRPWQKLENRITKTANEDSTLTCPEAS